MLLIRPGFEGCPVSAPQLLLFAVSLLAPDAAPPARPDPAGQKEAFAEAVGSVTVGGKKVEYGSTAGRLQVKDRTGKATAHVFFMAYVKKGVEGRPETRP